MENRRSFYRIQYPKASSPTFKSMFRKYQIVNISEGGLCFLAKSRLSFRVNQSIKGSILFPSRGHDGVIGVVHRVDGLRISIRFTRKLGLTLSRIMAEQRHLIRECGGF